MGASTCPAGAAETLACAVLRGDPRPWPDRAEPDFADAFLQSSARHGVRALLYHELKDKPCWTTWPEAVRDLLHREALRRVAVELIQRQELAQVLNTLARAGIHPLLLKGAALAYTHYPAPALRPRGDTDLLIDPEQRAATDLILNQAGYRRLNAVSGEWISYQSGYEKFEPGGGGHVLDVHWRLSNNQTFAGALHHQELHSLAVAVPALGAHAYALAPVHALLLAAMHRVAHLHAPYYVDDIPYYDGNRLIWLYDIHLLGAALSPQEWRHFADLAEHRQLREICLDGLRHATAAFGTVVPLGIWEALAVLANATEASAAHLRPGRWRTLQAELRSLPGWRERLALLQEHVFPPPHYMLAKYATDRRWLLPWLYARRLARGFRKRWG